MTHDNGAHVILHVAVKEAVLEVWDSREFDNVGDSEGADMVAAACLDTVAAWLNDLYEASGEQSTVMNQAILIAANAR